MSVAFACEAHCLGYTVFCTGGCFNCLKENKGYQCLKECYQDRNMRFWIDEKVCHLRMKTGEGPLNLKSDCIICVSVTRKRTSAKEAVLVEFRRQLTI